MSEVAIMRILIIVITVLVFAATLGTIVIGVESFEGVVVEKPYEAGLAWDQVRQNREKLGWIVTPLNPLFKIGSNELLLKITDSHGVPLSDAVVRVTVSRPATRDYDKTYVLERQPDNTYRAAIELPLKGNWDLVSDIHCRGDHAEIKNIAYAEAASKEEGIRCDIQQGPCIAELEDGVKIAFEILPKPVTALSDLVFLVTLSRNGKPVTNASVQLDLSMPHMFMGRNRPLMKQTAEGRFEGNVVITRCASGRKTWKATVSVEHDGKSSAADFIFEVQ